MSKAPPWKVNIITLFPEVFPGVLGISVIGKALENGIWSLKTFNLRDYVLKARVDDTPYGGGPGMLIRPDVLGYAIDSILEFCSSETQIVFTSPRGKLLNDNIICSLTAQEVIIICGRFEGIDQRIIDYYNIQEISIGDYVISGGEVASMVILDACIRTLDGTIGNSDSLQSESFTDGLLEYPQYTKPAQWRGISVPEVLMSGHHKNIQNWKLVQSKEITMRIRPDLLKK